MQSTSHTTKTPRPKRRLQLPDALTGWLSTLALIVFILYAGYLLGTGAQNGAPGLEALRRNPYGLAYLGMMLLFAVFFAVPAPRRGALWLAVPVGVYLCMTLVRLYRPLVITAATLYACATVQEAGQLAALRSLLGPLALALLPYLLQLAVLGCLLGQLWGHGRRTVYLVLCGLWALAAVANTLAYLPAGWRQILPSLLGMLSFCGAAALLALPVWKGARVTVGEAPTAEDAPMEEDAAVSDAPAGATAEDSIAVAEENSDASDRTTPAATEETSATEKDAPAGDAP